MPEAARSASKGRSKRFRTVALAKPSEFGRLTPARPFWRESSVPIKRSLSSEHVSPENSGERCGLPGTRNANSKRRHLVQREELPAADGRQQGLPSGRLGH